MTFAQRVREFIGSQYLPIILGVWCFAPGLRRIMDWGIGGRSALSIFSILPILMLLPLAIFVYKNAASERLQLPFKALAYLWLFGFGYALFVALASGGRAGAFYDFAQFCVPMLVGAWIIMRPASRAATFSQLCTTLLWLGVVESFYALYQYVAPPPWDIAYVNDLHQESLGIPEPFGLHPFSMLNSSGSLSVFLVVVMLLNLHRLDLRRPWPLIAVSLSVVVLILTNIRSCWLAFIVGASVFLLLSPRRANPIFALSVVGVVATLFVFNASVIVGNSEVSTQIQSRLNSLGNVDEDPSVNGRREEVSFALHQGIAEPLGQGLGSVGTAVWLESGGGDNKVRSLVLDSGYLSRFLEMGIPGTLFFIATVLFAFIFGLRALRLGVRTKNVVLQNIAVGGLSVQAALIGLDLSSDYHSALPGVFFWIVLGLSLRYEDGDQGLRAAWDRESVAPRRSPVWT